MYLLEIVKELLKQLEVGNYHSLQLSVDEKESPDQPLVPTPSLNSQVESLIGDRALLNAPAIPMDDVIIVADALKIWFRKMPEPITTFALYDLCIEAGKQECSALALVSLHSPVLSYFCFSVYPWQNYLIC